VNSPFCPLLTPKNILFSVNVTDNTMEGQYGDLSVFPKELKFIVLALLDAKSLGRVMQLNRAYSTLPSDLNIWKHFCLTQWNLPLDSK
jgi:hypothetical protein